MARGPSQAARDLLAEAIEEQGPAWANTAHAVRGGFSNIWIEPALIAIDRAMDSDRESLED